MMVANTEQYTGQNVTFYITDTKLAVETPLQFFIIIPSEPYYTKRVKSIKTLIRIGEIQSISDLANYAGGKITWYTSKRDWL